MATLQWVEDWRNYPVGPLSGSPWNTSVPPSLSNSGRNGKRAVNWNKNGISRPAANGSQSSHFFGVYRVDSGGRVLSSNASEVQYPANTLTTAHWLMGGAVLGYAYSGIAVTEDGALHLVRGSAFDLGIRQDVAVVASTVSGVVPIGRGWFVLEAYFLWSSTGRAIVRVNGNVVLSVYANTLPIGDYCEYVQRTDPCPSYTITYWEGAAQTSMEFIVGAGSRGGASLSGNQGWTGAVDFLASFVPVDENDVIGTDLRVDDLIPVSDGDTVQSTIGGTSPASTRWQSVDDTAAPDGDSTTVVFDRDLVPLLDEYDVSAFPFGSGTIYGVQVAADLKTSVPGYSDIQIGLKNGTGIVDSSVRTVRSNIYNRFTAAAPEKPGGGAWDVAALANLQARFRRQV